MGEAEDTAEDPVPDTQDLPKKKKKKKTDENDIKAKPVQSKSKRSDAQEEGYCDSLDKKLGSVVESNDTEIALKSITVKVRNKLLLFNSSGMEGGWFDQVYNITHSNRTHTEQIFYYITIVYEFCVCTRVCVCA